MLIQKLAMVIHHINIIHMVVLVQNNFHVIIVKEIYLVHDTYLKMNIHIVLNAMKIVLLIYVKNVEEKLVLIQKIFHIKIVIGMKNVFFVQCVKHHLLINHLVVKMNNFTVVNVIINNLLHVAINVIKYSNQVKTIFSISILIIEIINIFQALKNLNIVDNNFMNIVLLAMHVHNQLERKVLFQKIKKAIVSHAMKNILQRNVLAVIRY